MSEPFNVVDGPLDAAEERPGYRHARATLGPRLGADRLGVTVYELPPGERTFPYHYEIGCEEWLIVVTGRPTLRRPDGERDLEPGDVVCFPEGPDGAHQVANRTDEPSRVLLLSTKPRVALAVYPDSGKVMTWTRGGQAVYRDEPVDYWDAED